jgi:hypothetical protein
MKFVTAVKDMNLLGWTEGNRTFMKDIHIFLSTLIAAGRSAGLAPSDCPYTGKKQ